MGLRHKKSLEKSRLLTAYFLSALLPKAGLVTMQPLTAPCTLSCPPRTLQHWILPNAYGNIDDIFIIAYIIYDKFGFVNSLQQKPAENNLLALFAYIADFYSRSGRPSPKKAPKVTPIGISNRVSDTPRSYERAPKVSATLTKANG